MNGSTRLSTAFAAPALVSFVTAGDGDTAANLDALVEGGADVIELGMPFTDPMADGPAIQKANIRSLAKGTTTADIFAIAAAFRQRHSDVPLVLMGYANPMVRRGPEWFAEECAKAGVDGVICVDIPPEEDAALGPALRAAGVAPIRLATPTTDDERLPRVVQNTSGFVYYVSITGITGAAEAEAGDVGPEVVRIQKASGLPVIVGFGVNTPEKSRAIAQVADGVVVGSAIVSKIADGNSVADVLAFVKTLSDGAHSV